MTKTSSILVNILLYVSITGLVGFEPTNVGVKVLCLLPLGDSPLEEGITPLKINKTVYQTSSKNL